MILDTVGADDTLEKNWFKAHFTVQLAARFKGWMALIAVCSGSGFFWTLRLHSAYLKQHQGAETAHVAEAAQQPAPEEGIE